MTLPEKITAWGHFGPESVTGEWSADTYDQTAPVAHYTRDDLTSAQVLAEAVKLEAVRELVKAAKWIGVAAQTTGGTAGPDLDLIEAINVLADALAKIGGAA